MSELKIACPSCGGHIEFPIDRHGQVINCPHCTLSVPLKIPGTATPKQAVYGKQIKGDNRWLGVVLAIIGLLLIVSCYGVIIGVPLLIWGCILGNSLKCSECGSKVSGSAKFCPACECNFE